MSESAVPGLPFSASDIDAVLFDMDGTLVNTDDTDVAKWARRVARLYRTPQRAARAARRIVMLIESPANAAFSALDLVGLDTLAVRLMIGLQGGKHGLKHIPAIDGVAEMLAALAGRYKLGVVSTRTVAESSALLANLGIQGHFSALAGRDSTWRIKPHPQPVRYAAQALGVDPRRCLMVGDTTVDVRAGRRAGAWTVGVLCGYGEQAELERAGAHAILDSTGRLGELLRTPPRPG